MKVCSPLPQVDKMVRSPRLYVGPSGDYLVDRYGKGWACLSIIKKYFNIPREVKYFWFEASTKPAGYCLPVELSPDGLHVRVGSTLYGLLWVAREALLAAPWLQDYEWAKMHISLWYEE